MLVLTRKSHEQIQIGDNITVTILRVKGGAIRVGIDAPRNVTVLRKELANKMAIPVAAEAACEEPMAIPSRKANLLSGGKTKSQPAIAADNPARPSGAAPLGRFLARV